MLNSIAATTTLNNGVKMPWFGLGTWQATGNGVRDAVTWALDAGYRHIDTAMIYNNETDVGHAVRESGVPRREIFVTTKVWNSDQRLGYDAVLKAFDASMGRLNLEYVDLYLVHWALPGTYKDAWRALEKIYGDGRGPVKAIGVSNFMVPHLEDVLKTAKVVPAVNQVEFHPWLRQQPLLDFCAKHKIQHEAWSPLIQGKVKDIPELKTIGAAHQKSPAQIALRWGLQKGSVMIPKSVNQERLATNAAIFDFELSAAEMAQIDALDRNQRVGADPFNVTF